MQQHKNIRHVGHSHLALPNAHRLDHDHIKTRVLTNQHAFAGFLTHPA